uniref:PH domain-containing protein n=1 Tax=Aureoumbra lagunensis TaxID=44058 RepID=A0A7S3JUP7_9STRA
MVQKGSFRASMLVEPNHIIEHLRFALGQTAWLQKKSKSLVGYQWRFFLASGRYLRYFADESLSELLAAVDVRGAEVEAIGKRTLALRRGKAKFVLRCGDERERNNWLVLLGRIASSQQFDSYQEQSQLTTSLPLNNMTNSDSLADRTNKSESSRLTKSPQHSPTDHIRQQEEKPQLFDVTGEEIPTNMKEFQVNPDEQPRDTTTSQEKDTDLSSKSTPLSINTEEAYVIQNKEEEKKEENYENKAVNETIVARNTLDSNSQGQAQWTSMHSSSFLRDSAFTRESRASTSAAAGMLLKKHGTHWRLRYFLLYGHYLRYFKSDQVGAPLLGAINLHTTTIHPANDNGFSITTDDNRLLHFRSDDQEAARNWVATLIEMQAILGMPKPSWAIRQHEEKISFDLSPHVSPESESSMSCAAADLLRTRILCDDGEDEDNDGSNDNDSDSDNPADDDTFIHRKESTPSLLLRKRSSSFSYDHNKPDPPSNSPPPPSSKHCCACFSHQTI